MKPTVSVIIVTHDRCEEFLARALDSVLSQDHPPKKIVVVDSGTDEHRIKTKEYLEGLDAHEIDIRLAGDKIMLAPEARNLGASLCTGDYLAFLDDDDEWFPEKLSSQLTAADDLPAVIYSPYIEENGGKPTEFRWAPATYPEILGRNLIGATSFPLIRSDVFRGMDGFDPGFEANQEWDLWIRVLRTGSCVYSSTLVGKKYDNPGLSTDASARKAGWRALFSKHREEYRKNRPQHREAAGMFYGDMKNRKNLTGIISSLIENIR